jgi:AcrR family transcriptional regulator
MYTSSTTETQGTPMARGRGSTSREAIVAAAVELVDRVGLEGLTMRSLASALGVVPMAAYRHFGNKGELLDAVIDDVTSMVQVPDPSQDWREASRAIALSIRRTLLAHPGVVTALVNRPRLGSSAVLLAEALYAALQRGGFPADALEPSANLLFTYVLGFLALEAPRRSPAGGLEQGLHIPQVEVTRIYAELDAAAHPITASIAPDAAEFVSERQFAWGLETVLDGLERRRSQ